MLKKFRLIIQPQGNKWAWKIQHFDSYYEPPAWDQYSPWETGRLANGLEKTIAKAELRGRLALAECEAQASIEQRQEIFKQENIIIIEH